MVSPVSETSVASNARMPGDDHTLIVLPDAPHSFVIDMQSPNAHYADAYFPSLRAWLLAHGLSRPGCMKN